MNKNTDIKELIKNINEAIDEALEAMNEMSIAWVDNKAKKCCWVENSGTHTSNDYFKYYDSFSYRKADKIARISLRNPLYLSHRNSDGKDNWILTDKEKRELVKLMNSPSESREGFTNWQATLIQYNLDNFYIQPRQTIEGTFDKKKYPNAYSIDTPMPDYTKLKEK